jgi:hypothetical protein
MLLKPAVVKISFDWPQRKMAQNLGLKFFLDAEQSPRMGIMVTLRRLILQFLLIDELQSCFKRIRIIIVTYAHFSVLTKTQK